MCARQPTAAPVLCLHTTSSGVVRFRQPQTTQLIVSSRARLVPGADKSWPATATIVGVGRLHGRLASSVEGSMLCGVLAPMWLHMALGRLSASPSTSGEALSLPYPLSRGRRRLGSSAAPLSLRYTYVITSFTKTSLSEPPRTGVVQP